MKDRNKLRAMHLVTKHAITNFNGEDISEVRAMVKRFAKKEKEILKNAK